MYIIDTNFNLADANTKWSFDTTKIIFTSDYRFWIKYNYQGNTLTEYFTIKKGWSSDGGSIPDIVYTIPGAYTLVGAKYGDYTLNGFVLHDYLYFINWHDNRLHCDQMMYFMHREAKYLPQVGWFRANTIYYNVRWFGSIAWNNHKKRNEKLNSDLINQ